MLDDAWTGDRTDLLKKLWAEGKTAAVIAASLGGISRSAVLGKIFRLRLGSVENKALPVVRVELPGWRRTGVRPKKPGQPSRAVQTSPGKTLLELTNGSCRWPIGHPGTRKFHFCGEPGADLDGGMPYCARHALRAYRTGNAQSATFTP